MKCELQNMLLLNCRSKKVLATERKHDRSALHDPRKSLKPGPSNLYLIPGKGEDENQRETNMVVQDWEEIVAEHLLLNACSFRGACINAE